MTTNERFAALVSSRRKELRLSQAEVGAAVGRTQSSVSHWEAGEVESFLPDDVRKLASKLEVPGAVLSAALGYPVSDGSAEQYNERDLAWMVELPSNMSDAAWAEVVQFARWRADKDGDNSPTPRAKGDPKGR